MLRLLKRVTWMGFLAVGLPAAHAFSTLGPTNTEPYQVHDLGYNLRSDVGGPMNVGEDYRRNVPVLYYAFDETFLDFFGSNGVAAVEQAFAIMNNLRPVSSYSSDLSEVPLETKRFNQTAGALNLIDLKSETLSLLVEQLGLADSIRFTWTLHDRVAGANCPVGNQYLVTKRNYAIVPSALDQLQYSSYVNGVLYSYYIHDYCANPPGDAPLSEALEIPVDVFPNAERFTPVSSFSLFSLAPGGFYTDLTRDDVAGLRYLLRSGHVHWEDVPTNSIVFVTNTTPSALQLIVTSNLTLLAAQSLTNDDAGLQTLYPTISIVPGSTVPYFTNLITTNLSGYFTNYPLEPVGTPPHLVFVTNFTTNATFAYSRSFANVVTNSASSVSFVTVISTNLYAPPMAPPGFFQTNITTVTMLTNLFAGDYYIIPTNSCGVKILSNVLTSAIGVTNSLIVTNVPTNGISGTFLLGRTYINWVTNHYLAAFPVLCVSNQPGLRRGVEKITFVKTEYDSLLGRFYIPQTNYFTMTTVTNSTNWVQTYQRVVNFPDFIFTAQDMMPGPADPLNSGAQGRRSISWNTANRLPGQAGPGTIDSPTQIIFNKSGPIYYNVVTNHIWSLDELTAARIVMWASYDDSTNAPVVYPNGTSIASLESQMLMQVTSTTLPPGKVGVAYSTQLTGTGGSGPAPYSYTWTLEEGTPALPPGLVLTLNGRLSGTPPPGKAGIYYFFVRMTDQYGGFTVWQVTLTILP